MQGPSHSMRGGVPGSPFFDATHYILCCCPYKACFPRHSYLWSRLLDGGFEQ